MRLSIATQRNNDSECTPALCLTHKQPRKLKAQAFPFWLKSVHSADILLNRVGHGFAAVAVFLSSWAASKLSCLFLVAFASWFRD